MCGLSQIHGRTYQTLFIKNENKNHDILFYLILPKMARFIAGDISKYVQTDTALVLNKISELYFKQFEYELATWCSFRFYKKNFIKKIGIY